MIDPSNEYAFYKNGKTLLNVNLICNNNAPFVKPTSVTSIIFRKFLYPAGIGRRNKAGCETWVENLQNCERPNDTRRNVPSSRLAESFNVSSLKTSRLSSSRSSHSTFVVSLFIPLSSSSSSPSLPYSAALAFPSVRLASTLVHQSGNPGIMNSQLSLAIPALPANTTLYEFAQLLAWLFSDVE